MHSRSEGGYARSYSNPGAVVNTDNEALAEYKKTKKRLSRLNNIDALEQRIAVLEQLLLKAVSDK